MFGDSFRAIGDTYRELATLVESGQPLIQGLEFFRRPEATALARELKRGQPLHAAMVRGGFPALDVAVMRVAEDSGRLPDCARLLSRHYLDRETLLRTFRGALVKPGLLALAALFLLDLPKLASGDLTARAYLLRNGGVAVLAVAGALTVFRAHWRAMRSPRGAVWPTLLKPLPWAGAFVTALAMDRFFTALRLATRSGLDAKATLELAGSVAGDPAYVSAIQRAGRDLERAGLASALERAGLFRESQLQALRVGEASGKVDEALDRICAELREEIERRIAQFADWAPKIIYGCAVAFAAYRILESMPSMPPLGE